jgi:hypothetical protein
VLIFKLYSFYVFFAIVVPQIAPFSKSLIWAFGAIGALGYIDTSFIQIAPNRRFIHAPAT